MTKTLIYCGLYRGVTFRQLVPHFDIAIGFEPSPELFHQLEEEYRNWSNVTVVHAAVAEYEGTITFHIHSFDAASSIGTLTNEWRRIQGLNITPVKTIEVPCVHLGFFLEKMNVRNIDALVTDAEGYDLTILRSVEPLIRNRMIRCITCEVERDNFPFRHDGVPSNKEKDFHVLLGDDYELVRRLGEKDWFCHDLTWLRKHEEDRTLYPGHASHVALTD